MPDKYLFVGSHADSLASGRPVAPYEEIPPDAVDLDSVHDQALIDDGKLIAVEDRPVKLTGDALDKRADELDIEGRSKMNADQKRAAIEKREAELAAEAEKEANQ